MPRYSEKQKAALDNLMKEDVFRHATAILTEEGLGSLTMERLASAVGVSRGTLYNYFDDKDAVVDFVEERVFGPLIESIEQVVAGDLEPESKLTRIAEITFQGIYEERALVVALVPDKHSDASRPRHLKRRSTVLAAIERIVREGVGSGVFRNLPSTLAAELFVSIVSGLMDSMKLSGRFMPPEDVVPTLMDIYLGGLRSSDGESR